MVEILKRAFDRLLDAVVILLMAGLAVVVIVAVVARYLFNFPLAWSEEVSRYSFIWLSFLGAVVCLRERVHLGVDLLVRTFPEGLRRGLDAVGQFLMAVMLIVVLVSGVKVTRVTYDQQSPALGMPMSYVYVAAPVGAALMLVELLGQFVERRTGARRQREVKP